MSSSEFKDEHEDSVKVKDATDELERKICLHRQRETVHLYQAQYVYFK